MINEIFKIPLYNTTLSLDTKSIRSLCLSYLKKEPKGRQVSNRGGWQSDELTLPKFKHLGLSDRPLTPLCDSIRYHGKQFLKELEFNGELEINNIWININGYRDSNVLHNHNHCLLSGVYYVNAPKDSGNIMFFRPGYDTFTFDWNNYQKAWNPYNSATWKIPPTNNTLLLFPSWLNHTVDPNMNKKEKRISISFNLSFKAS